MMCHSCEQETYYKDGKHRRHLKCDRLTGPGWSPCTCPCLPHLDYGTALAATLGASV